MEKNNKAKEEVNINIDENIKLNKKLKRQNRRLRFLIHLLLSIIFILIGIVIGDYLYSKDYLRIFKIKEKKINCSYNVINNSKEAKEKIEFTGEYETTDISKESQESVYIKIKFYENNMLNMITYYDSNLIENTEGTYLIEDNKIIYKRIYTYGGSDNKDIKQFVRIDENSTKNYNFSDRFLNKDNEEVILIDNEWNNLIIENYANLSLNNEKIILNKK